MPCKQNNSKTHIISTISLQRMLRPFPPLIYKKTWFSTGRMMYFIETFRALGSLLTGPYFVLCLNLLPLRNLRTGGDCHLPGSRSRSQRINAQELLVLFRKTINVYPAKAVFYHSGL